MPVYLKVVDGPFVLTDMAATINQPVLYALPAGQDCTLPSIPAAQALDGTNGRFIAALSGNLSRARLFIKAGEELCAAWDNSGTTSGESWSGFKPY